MLRIGVSCVYVNLGLKCIFEVDKHYLFKVIYLILNCKFPLTSSSNTFKAAHVVHFSVRR